METVKENKNSQSKPKSLGKESFFSAAPIQTKLQVNQPGDKYEVEADQVAEQVIQKISVSASDTSSTNPRNENNFNPKPSNSPETNAPKTHVSSLIQTKCESCETEEKENPKEEEIQRKHEPHIFLQADNSQEYSTLMAKSQTSDSHPVSPHTAAQLFASKGGGDPLPKNTRSEMERGFGVDFSNVRTHTRASAVDMSKNLGAQAFTHGLDIYFNSGKFEPNSQSGKKLLAHELTHVVQHCNDNGVNGTILRKVFGNRFTFDSQKICPPKAEILQSDTKDSEIAEDLYGNSEFPIDYIDENNINIDYENLLDEWKPIFTDCVDPQNAVISSESKIHDLNVDENSSDLKSGQDDSDLLSVEEGFEFDIYSKENMASKIFSELGYCKWGLAFFTFKNNKYFLEPLLKMDEDLDGYYNHPTAEEISDLDSKIQSSLENPEVKTIFSVERARSKTIDPQKIKEDDQSENDCETNENIGECYKQERTDAYRQAILEAGKLADAYYDPFSGDFGLEMFPLIPKSPMRIGSNVKKAINGSSKIKKSFSSDKVPYSVIGLESDFKAIEGIGVYVLKSTDGKILYVGEGKIFDRLRSHIGDPSKTPWFGEIGKMDVYANNLTKKQAHALEEDLISQLNPTHNKVLKPFEENYPGQLRGPDLPKSQKKLIFDVEMGTIK